MAIETDIWSLTAVLLGTFLAGALATGYYVRGRWKRNRSPEKMGKETLYLVFSRVGHRLKTASEVIRGHLHGFTDELPNDAERWRVARRAITEEASAMNTMIERLDLVVRLGMAEQPLVIEPVNVPRMLEDLMVEFGPAADSKGISLGGVVNSTTGVYVSGDTSALREVFANLLENAVRHNGRGTEITAKVAQQDNNLLVCIADTGKGMTSEVLSGLFEKTRPDYHPRMVKGTGMGLHLCKLLVELHGGRIVASATEGKGTEFRILLPLRRTK